MDHELGQLYQDASFARRLASGLVGEAGSEDVWQEVWHALLLRPRPAWDLRTLLHQLVQRRALKLRRGELRRRARERAAARDECLPSTEELVARTEIHRAVVDALLALEEPFRRTLLLIFFEDLDPREIARREGIPLETVRTRRKRALVQLRERLERAHGDRREWLAGLAALAGMRPEAPAAPHAALPATLAPLAVGLVLVGGIAWWVQATREGARDTLASDVSRPSAVATIDASGPATPERDPMETGTALPSTATEREPPLAVGAHVVDEGGAGIPQAELRVRVIGLFSSEPLASGRSDASGRCTFSLPAPAPLWARSRSLQVEAWASGFRPALQVLALAEAKGAIQAELVLLPGMTLEGCVRDERGLPVVGAIVNAHYAAQDGNQGAELGESDEDGEYRIGLAPGSIPGEIEAWRAVVGAGFIDGAGLPLKAPLRAPDLVLEERYVFRGLATYPDGTPARDFQVMVVHVLEDGRGRSQPAPKATVSAGGPPRMLEFTDAEGHFAARGLAEGSYAAFPTPSFDPSARVFASGEEAQVVVEQHRVLLEVVDAAGEALADVEVACTPLAPRAGGGWMPARECIRSVTRESGFMGFTCEPGTVALTALVPGRAVEVLSSVAELPYEVRERIVLARDEPRGALRLLAKDSTPLSDVAVTLATAAARIPLERFWHSGADGLVRDLPAGAFRVEFRCASDDPWILPEELELAIPAGGALDVELAPRRGGKLSVLFESAPEDVAHAQRATRHSGKASPRFLGTTGAPALRRAEDSAEGPPFLELSSARPGEPWNSEQALPSGRYRLDATFDGYEPVTEWLVIEPEHTSSLRLPLVLQRETER